MTSPELTPIPMPAAAQSETIAVFYQSPSLAPLLQALQGAWPEAQWAVWPEVAPQATKAVVWAPTQAFIDQHPHLQYLFNMGAGVDALLQLQLPEQLQVVRIEDGGMAVQMAEYVTYAVLRHVREFDHYAHSQAKAQWQPRAMQQRADFPIGVMGLGVLGAHVAKVLAGLGFEVNGWSQSPKQIEGVHTYAGEGELSAFLQSSRILVCLLPLTPATEGILNRANLQQLQAGAYLINVARGGHLVEADLLALLEEGHLAGAMLDVCQPEPLPPEHPFWRHPRITLTPHISAQTGQQEAAQQITANARRIACGQAPHGLVNRSGGY
ncbi:glyoxylate/hydroxypyruvate reductase A [Lampropedia aestuarii]|nr:glyoxylate/hydroxypyruvate reductase A [Lampropedia aestuarii]MDH5858061.1 glyoxylate/hydroxypyruvate reductase A [Lampropedia aestuarii]